MLAQGGARVDEAQLGSQERVRRVLDGLGARRIGDDDPSILVGE